MEHANRPAYEASTLLMPDLASFRQILRSNPKGGWQKCWEEGVTPWDLGTTTPIIQHLVDTEALPKGRALVPGCGQGYDVLAMASAERYVVGLDLSEGAILKAKELASSSAKSKHVKFVLDDFFTWEPTEKFDLIFDYAFFCALEPQMRSAWASRMADLLAPDGELITLIFPISDHDGGPPYKVSVSEYDELLCPLGFKAVLISDNDLAVESRKGYEKLGRWNRAPNSTN